MGAEDIPIGIPEFYRGRSLFVTGFTGYLGKLLVEKLIYSCPDIDKIYVLIRPKKGTDPLDRVKEVTSLQAFDRLREKYPDALESKIIPLEGDLLEDRIGLSPENEDLIKREVSVLFHVGANVKFDNPLNIAVRSNTLAAKKIVDLALTMQKLESFIYVSTAYTNCDQLHIKEELYPPKADWKSTLAICEKIDPAVIQILTKKYLSEMPNTYVFSKSLSEQVVNEYRDRLPVAIVRPSIVIAAADEPISGWTDNMYGPMILFLGFLIGIVRCSWADDRQKCNYIHSDIVIKSIVIASWKTAIEWKKISVNESIKVYNACAPPFYDISTKEVSTVHLRPDAPDTIYKDSLNFISLLFINSEFWFKLNAIYRHLLPAAFVDLILVILKRKPMLMKVRRRVQAASCALSHFTHRTFKFELANFDGLVEDLRPEDKDAFAWDFKKLDFIKIYYNTYECSKLMLLKPLFQDLDSGRRKLAMLYYVDRSAVYLFYSFLLCLFVFVFRVPQNTLLMAQSLVYF